MFKKLLLAVGLSKAPSPIRRFVGANAFFGTIPALVYVGWKYRGWILNLFRRGEDRLGHVLPAHVEGEGSLHANP